MTIRLQDKLHIFNLGLSQILYYNHWKEYGMLAKKVSYIYTLLPLVIFK